MSYSIGPIQLRSLTNHTWSASQISLTTDIQSQPQVGFVTDQEMVSYNLIGSFFADTAVEARIQRKQINDIIANPNLQQVYITFDQDDDELSGWFVIDSLETTIDAAIFNHYSFTLGVRRLKTGSGKTGLSWKSKPYNSAYTNTFEVWLSFPPNRFGSSKRNAIRRGADGQGNEILYDVEKGKHSFFTYDNFYSFNFQSGTSSAEQVYQARCKIYDTVDSNSTSDPTDPDETDWIERFGTYINFEGDAVFGNNLLRYVWDGTIDGSVVYAWTGSNWELICTGLSLVFSTTPTTITSSFQPTVEYFDWNKIIWHENYLTDEGRNVSVRYKMLRGSWTLHVAVKSDQGNLSATTKIEKYAGNSHSSYSQNLTSSNYRIALGTTVLTTPIQYGLFYTDGSVGGGSGGDIELGYTTSPGIWTRFGLFISENPLVSGELITDITNQYLANMDFQETIINPVMMV